jgi:NAD(P)-dependent dehydrogenase (short-subunit alcohol dehydrogenase family)
MTPTGPMFDLTGRVALVTGAGQGMGVGITHALAAQGARVVVNDLDPLKAEAASARLVSGGYAAVAAAFDVTDEDDVAASVARVEGELGQGIDILVNNAGVPLGMELQSFRELDPAGWRRYVDLNLYGSLNCIHAVIDGMCDRGWGRVVQISSGAGRTGIAFGVSLYGASKSGIEGFIRHLSQEVAGSGVTANSLALGLMANAVPGDDSSPAVQALARSVPVGRLGTPDDVGAAVTFLASNEAAWLTGQTIDLNGGAVTH